MNNQGDIKVKYIIMFADKGRSMEINESDGNISRGRIKFDTEVGLAALPRFLRLIQFLTTLVLFSLTVYLTAMSMKYLTDVACILLICLTCSHLFFQGLDIMNQFFGDSVPESPMYIFSLTGMILFAIAGILLIYYVTSYMSFWAILMAMVLCFIISLLYAIEVIAVLLYWKKKYSSWKKCHPLMVEGSRDPTIKTIFSKACEFPSSDTKVCKCEITTSVSGQGLVDPTVDTAMEHETRKINFARRRQYVDCPCSVPALSIMTIAQVQTESGLTTPGEAQTMKAQLKEITIQTASKCELCHRDIDKSSSPLATPLQISTGQLQSTPDHQSSELTNVRQESSMIPPQYLATPQLPQPAIMQQTQPPQTLCSQYRIPCSSLCPPSVVILRGGGGSCCGSCNCCDHPDKHNHTNAMQDKASQQHQRHSDVQCTTTSTIVDSDIDRTSGDQEPDEKGSSVQRRINKINRRI